MRYNLDDISKMRYHTIMKRIDQYTKYKKKMAEAISDASKKIKK